MVSVRNEKYLKNKRLCIIQILKIHGMGIHGGNTGNSSYIDKQEILRILGIQGLL